MTTTDLDRYSGWAEKPGANCAASAHQDIDPHTPGAKLDAGKARPDLILNDMPRALMALAEIAAYGAQKYTEGGWVSVPNGIQRYTAAMDRHRLAEHEGCDPESGFLHAAHTAWNALARLELILRMGGGAK